MKKIEREHPFQIKIINVNNTPKIVINKGFVYNYYNPLNFRNVKWNRDSSFLPSTPLPLDNDSITAESIVLSEYGIDIPSDKNAVNIYLLCSFLPPQKWVPSSFYIPVVDNAWILCVFVNDSKDEEGNSVSNYGNIVIKGETQNSSARHIKYECHDVNQPNFQPEILAMTGGNAEDFYKDFGVENSLGNAFNMCLIGQAEKLAGGSSNSPNWIIYQYIKDNYPITFFLNTETYLACNTNMWNSNITENFLGEEEFFIYQQIYEANGRALDLTNFYQTTPNQDDYAGHFNFKKHRRSKVKPTEKGIPKFPTFFWTDWETLSPD